LKPATTSGKVVEEVQACKVPKDKRELSTAILQRNHEFQFFEKRDNHTCNSIMKLRKRQGIMDPDGMDGHMSIPDEVPQYNVIKPEKGKQAYARVPASMYNELFYTQADKSGLMTIGAQHGVRISKHYCRATSNLLSGSECHRWVDASRWTQPILSQIWYAGG
jgi:hypothetical protein